MYSFKMNGLIVMRGRSKSLILWASAAALAATPALAQVRPAKPVAAPAAKPTGPAAAAPDALVPGNPDYDPQAENAPAPVPAPAPLPPAVWDPVSAQDLVYYIQQVGGDGLDPADYDAPGLVAAMQSGDPMAMSAAATERFNQLSSDLALGHVKRSARTDWFVSDKDLDAEKQDALLRSALATHQVRDALNALLPSHPQ